MSVDIEKKGLLMSILIKIGFQSTGNGLEFDFGNCKLKAIQSINQDFKEGYNFFGYYISERRAGEISFFLPLRVESYEQCIAIIAYYLRKADLKDKPEWLQAGLALEEQLPWKKAMKAYDENPHAILEHEWFRIIVKKIRLLSSASTDEDITTFSFVDSVLKIVCNNQTIIVGGLGKNWHQTATVKTKSLTFLPKRIPNRAIYVFIWQNKLNIGNRVFNLEV